MSEATPQRQAQVALLHAVHRHDVIHLIDTIEDIGPNRWLALHCAGNERTAAIRIEGDGRLTGYLGKWGQTDAAEILRGQWTAGQLVGAAVAWMEFGLGGPPNE
jgi:hypothetical protein